MKRLTMLFLFLVPIIVLAEVAPVAQAQGVPVFDKIIEWLSSAVNWPTLSVIGALIFETLLRILKTSRPLSIAWLVRDVSHQIGEMFEKLAELLDKVLPQRVKEVEAPKVEEKK